jgi:thioredoxin reductase
LIYDVYDVVIVDGGLAGLIAAIVVTRMGIHTVLVESKLLDLPDTKEGT